MEIQCQVVSEGYHKAHCCDLEVGFLQTFDSEHLHAAQRRLPQGDIVIVVDCATLCSDMCWTNRILASLTIMVGDWISAGSTASSLEAHFSSTESAIR